MRCIIVNNEGNHTDTGQTKKTDGLVLFNDFGLFDYTAAIERYGIPSLTPEF
jgi:hypothetical protein